MRARRALGVAVLAVVLGTLGACGDSGTSGGESSDGPVLSTEGQFGEKVAASMGCRACHSVDGRKGVGPTWEGLYGSEVTLKDGSTVTADDEYLRRAIVDPSADKVEGYSTPMPTVKLTDEQVDQLVTYIRELGGGTTDPPGG